MLPLWRCSARGKCDFQTYTHWRARLRSATTFMVPEPTARSQGPLVSLLSLQATCFFTSLAELRKKMHQDGH